jgi:hypothetical protein
MLVIVRYTVQGYVVISTNKHVRELYNNFLYGGSQLRDGLWELDIYVFNNFSIDAKILIQNNHDSFLL